MLKPALWPKLQEVARLRIETKLIAGIKSGIIRANGAVTQALATWSNNYISTFTLRAEAELSLINKFESADANHRRFAARFFSYYLADIVESDARIDRCVRAIAAAVKGGDEEVRSRLITAIPRYPELWQKKLAEALSDETDPDNPAVRLRDNSPFLSSPTKTSELDDDIRF
jgi:hypothetical protein